MTPHEALKAAVEERMRLAEEATANPRGPGLVNWLLERMLAPMPDWAERAGVTPAFVIRDCERDLKALERHAPMASLGALGCSHCRDGFDLGALAAWPCPDYRDLAEVYQINLGVSG